MDNANGILLDADTIKTWFSMWHAKSKKDKAKRAKRAKMHPTDLLKKADLLTKLVELTGNEAAAHAAVGVTSTPNNAYSSVKVGVVREVVRARMSIWRPVGAPILVGSLHLTSRGWASGWQAPLVARVGPRARRAKCFRPIRWGSLSFFSSVYLLLLWADSVANFMRIKNTQIDTINLYN